MAAQAHRIERLNLDVAVAGFDSALQLRARVEELSRTRFPDVVARVLDAVIPADLQIRLDRLDLDLGAIVAERLEEDAPALLERAFAEAIAAAVERARQAPGDGARALTIEAAALEDLDTYLVQGIARFPAGAEAFDPAGSLRALIERQPEALTAMLRRRSRDRHVLERLVLQASGEDLQALLAMLAPADAAVILAYHADLRRLYLRRRPPPATPDLPRALWVLTLELILRDPGSQSNRRAFLAYLLKGLAVAEGIAYPALLALLRDALEQTQRTRPLTGSLPGVLKDLFARLADEDPAPSARPAMGQSAAEAEPGDIEPLLGLLRRAAGNRTALEALVRRVTAPVFARLIERLEPDHAAPIQTYLAGLATLHREAALLALSESGFERRLRLLALHLLLRETGSRFDRRSWLRHLLSGLARSGEVSPAFLRESLANALAAIRERLPAGPLPGAVADLAADLPRIPGADPTADLDTLSRRLSRLRRYANDRAAMAALVHGLSSTEFRRLVERLRPRNARAILADIADLGVVQRRQSLFALSDTAFEAQLRLLALQPLVAAPAAPFHRLSWLRQVLRGLAQAAGLEAERLPAVLAGAATQSPPGSALPGALARIAGAASVAADAAGTAGDRDGAALARRLARAAPADQAQLIRRLGGDPGLLLRVAAALDEATLTALLAAFGPAQAMAVTSDLALLRRRHEAEPLARLDAAAFRRLTWALAVAALAREGGRLRRVDIRRSILAGIARYQAVPAHEVGDWRQLEEDPAADNAVLTADARPAAAMPPPDLLALAERFLRSGRPPAFGPRLPEAASLHPSGFAALLRRLTVAASGNPGMLIDRLLTWMLPEEVVAALLPGAADRAANRAAILGEAPGGSMTAAWKQVLHAALANEDLGPADAPPSPGPRYDRLALLRRWLDRGTLAWWAPADTRIDTLLGVLPGQPVTVLRALFGDPDPERVAARLGRAFRRMEAAAGLALLERLAPWAFASAGPFAARAAGLGGGALDELRIRAAAAAIVGGPLDLDRLAGPVPTPPEAVAEPPQPPDSQDRAALFAWLRRRGPDGPPAPERLVRLLADLADRGDAELDAILRDGLAGAATRARWAAALPDEALARIVHRMAPARARFMLDLAAILTETWRQVAPAGASGPGGGGLWSVVLACAAERDLPSPRAIAGGLIEAFAQSAPAAADDWRAQAARTARQSGHAHIVAVLQPATAPEPPRPSAAAKRPAAETAPPPAPETGTVLYVANAGLVLFNPFLPRFFQRLDLLSTAPDGVPRIAGVESASRAVHLLQYLVDESCHRPEPDLLLNKLLCGIPPAAPVARSIDPAAEDLALCAEMIRAAIGSWPAIRNTSPAGLRETFLQREGRLRRSDDRWTLEVERKTVDVLVDQIPWNLAIVYHRWMAEPVHVTW